MYKNFIKQPNIENKNKYKNYKKKVEKCIYMAKRKFYNDQIEKFSNNAKKNSGQL